MSPSKTPKPSTQCFTDGRSRPALSGKTFASLNPSSGKVFANIAEADAADVDAAVAAARRAFDEGPWPRLSPSERKAILLKLADLVEAHREELAMLEALEAGKPITDCLEIDLPETVKTLRWHAEAADKIYDQVSPTAPSILSMIIREPVGVVGAVLPWNFPILMAAWKIAPALAMGNTMVVKPAEQTSTSTIRLAELASEAGLPDGVLNVVTGFGETVGKAIGLNPGIDCVAFTGSTEVGRMFLGYSAQSNLKRILLECGGKNSMIVTPDYYDFSRVARHATNAAFWNMGENCSANSRLLIHRSGKDALLEQVLREASSWVVGDPMDSRTRVGPLIEQGHLEKVRALIDSATGEGAKLAFGGTTPLKDRAGYFVRPTVLDEVSHEMRISREEVFGPVLALTVYDDIEDAVRMANDTPYGLAASIFSNATKSSYSIARALKAGVVSINCYSEGDISTSFGGYKLSGFGARDNSLTAHDQYCEIKTIWNDLS